MNNTWVWFSCCILTGALCAACSSEKQQERQHSSLQPWRWVCTLHSINSVWSVSNHSCSLVCRCVVFVCVYLQAYLWCAGAPKVGVIVKKFWSFFSLLSGAACFAELWRCEHHHLQSIFLSCSISSESGGLNEARGLRGWRGGGLLHPELAVRSWLPRLCSVWCSHGAEMGEIMIVWWSRGGVENGGCYWVIHNSEAGSPSNGTPPKAEESNCDDWCSFAHQIGCCIMGIRCFYCWIVWEVVLHRWPYLLCVKNKHRPYQLAQLSRICLPVFSVSLLDLSKILLTVYKVLKTHSNHPVIYFKSVPRWCRF